MEQELFCIRLLSLRVMSGDSSTLGSVLCPSLLRLRPCTLALPSPLFPMPRPPSLQTTFFLTSGQQKTKTKKKTALVVFTANSFPHSSVTSICPSTLKQPRTLPFLCSTCPCLKSCLFTVSPHPQLNSVRAWSRSSCSQLYPWC